MSNAAYIAYEAERRRRLRLGLDPLPEDEAKPGAVASAPLPYEDLTYDVDKESTRGLMQGLAQYPLAAGETIQALGGLIPGQSISGAVSGLGAGLVDIGEKVMPDRPIEGIGGALISGLNRAPIEILKAHGAMKLSEAFYGLDKLAFSKYGAALETTGSEVAALDAATKAMRVRTYLQGATAFGALGAAETAGMQRAQEGHIEIGEVFKAGLRGAATGAVWEAFAPFNILGRIAGLGAWGAAESAAMGEDPLEGGIMTAMYAAMPGSGLKGRDIRSETKHRIQREFAKIMKKAQRGENGSKYASETLEVMPELMEALKSDPILHSISEGYLNAPGAIENLAHTTRREAEANARAYGLEPTEVAKAGETAYKKAHDTIEEMRKAGAEYIDAETANIEGSVERIREKVESGEASQGDLQQMLEVKRQAYETARRATGITPETAGVMRTWAANTEAKGKSIRLRVKNLATRIMDPKSSISVRESQDLMAEISGFIPELSSRKYVEELGQSQAERLAAIKPESLDGASSEMGVLAFNEAMKNKPSSPENLRQAQEHAGRTFEQSVPQEGAPPASPTRDYIGEQQDAGRIQGMAAANDVAARGEMRSLGLEPHTPDGAPQLTVSPNMGPVAADALRQGAPAREQAVRQQAAVTATAMRERGQKMRELGIEPHTPQAEAFERSYLAEQQKAEVHAAQTRARERAQRMKELGIEPHTPEAEAFERSFPEAAPDAGAISKATADFALAKAEAKKAVADGRPADAAMAETRAKVAEIKAERAAMKPKSAAVEEIYTKEIEAGLESTKVATDRSEEAARIKIAKLGGVPAPATDVAPRTKINSYLVDRFGKAQGDAMTRLADTMSSWSERVGGRTRDEWWSTLGVETIEARNAEVAEAGGGKKASVPKGLIEFMKSGERVIRLSEKADFSTWSHELIHDWRRGLRGDALVAAAEAAGVKDPKRWSKANDEYLAKSVELALLTGQIKNKKLTPTLQLYKQYLADIHGALVPGGVRSGGETSPYFKGITVSPKLEPVLKELFLTKGHRSTEAAAEAYRNGIAGRGPNVLHQSSAAFEPPTTGLEHVNEFFKSGGGSNAMKVAAMMVTKTAIPWYKPLIDRVIDWDPELGQRFVKKNDKQRKIFGSFTPMLVEMSRMNESKQHRKAIQNELLKRTDIPGGAIAHLSGLMEGRVDRAGFSKEALQVVDLLQKIVAHQGALARGENVLTNGLETYQFDKSGQPKQRFQGVDKGEIMLQLFSKEAYHSLELGGGDYYDAWIRALSGVNPGSTIEITKMKLDKLRNNIMQSRASFENVREFENFPTHIDVNGKSIPVIETNPIAFAERLASNTAARLSFIMEFGRTGEGTYSNVPLHDGVMMKSLVEEFGGTGSGADGRKRLLLDVIRGANGLPIEMKPRIGPAPGEVGYDAVRALAFAESTLKTALLTRSVIANIPELMGNALTYGGSKRMAEVFREYAKDPELFRTELARSGALTPMMMHMVIEPGRRLESASAKIKDWVGTFTGHIPMNEFNELVSAGMGRVFKNDVLAGRADAADVIRLKRMRFTDAEIKKMMEIQPGAEVPRELAELVDAIETRFAEATQGSTSLPIERSRLANSRLYGHTIFADRFAMMKTDRTMREINGLISEFRTADGEWKAPTKAGLKHAATYFMGSAASGMAAAFLTAFAVGGPAGVDAWLEQAESDRMGVLTTGLTYSLVNGPVDAIWRGVTSEDERSVIGSLGDATLPGNVLQEGFDFMHGYGRYKNRSLLEKAAQFLRAEVPMSRAVRTWAMVAGMGGDPELEPAKSAFYKWLEKNNPQGRTSKSEMSESPEQKAFGIWMRRAHEALNDGDTGAAGAYISKAIGQDGKDIGAAKASLLGLRYMSSVMSKHTPEGLAMRAKLQKDIGDRAYSRLVLHDELLEAYAKGLA